ncbi:MAG: hypothetical protein J6Q54_06220, partial [Oscillospiraceae bacterium]|nr:hypothetical protein [Oscillospiraceae bacterium]
MKRFLAFALILAMLLPVFPVQAAEETSAEIYAMVLRPDCAGVYYQCRLTGDTTNVAAWGVAMSTAEMPDALTFKGYKYADRYKTNNTDDQSLALKEATAGTGGLVIYLYYDRVEYS